jgi:hypothetical protein
MSYCRFSSMNWMSDVYVYEDVSGGWTTHVARSRRVVPPVPDISVSLSSVVHRWSRAYWDRELREIVYPSLWRKRVSNVWFDIISFWHSRVHMGSLALIPLHPIGLPFDGESFNDPTAEDCADRLEWLLEMGYRVPRSAIDALREDAE